jgi:hypothetical protein
MYYRHTKTGRIYEKLGEATHSETGESLVIYKNVHDKSIWARPKAMFEDTVELNGYTVPRFEFIGLAWTGEVQNVPPAR